MKKTKWNLSFSKAKIFFVLCIIIGLLLVGMTPVINSIVIDDEKDFAQENGKSNYDEKMKTTGDYDGVYVYASFNWNPRYPDPGEEVTFISSSHANNGYITSQQWQFEDGHTAFGPVVTHTFQKKGDYRVTLQARARGYEGGSSSGTRTSNVQVGADPFPRITIIPEDPSPFEEVILDASDSSDPDGEIISYNWSYYDVETPDNITHIGSEEIIYYTWEKQGTYNIILLVEDNKGNNNTYEKIIDVSILKLTDFSKFSRGLSFNILNAGNITAEGVSWNVEIDKYSALGIRSRSLYEKNGYITVLFSNESQSINIKDMRRKFCKIELTVTAGADNALTVSKSYYGLIFGKYVYLSERNFINPYGLIVALLLIVFIITFSR